MSKADLNTPILSRLTLSRKIPRRRMGLYLTLLEEFDYAHRDARAQILIDSIAWTYCKIQDVHDSRYLYGEQMSLPSEGNIIQTREEQRMKQAEYELLPKLQKQLLQWLDALDGKTAMKNKEECDLASLLNEYDDNNTNE